MVVCYEFINSVPRIADSSQSIPNFRRRAMPHLIRYELETRLLARCSRLLSEHLRLNLFPSRAVLGQRSHIIQCELQSHRTPGLLTIYVESCKLHVPMALRTQLKWRYKARVQPLKEWLRNLRNL